jgi:hypothetical protein
MTKIIYVLTFLVCLCAIALFSLSGCTPYKVTFNPQAKTIESKIKGVYKYKDKDVEMSADFGKPLLDIGKIAPKYERD